LTRGYAATIVLGKSRSFSQTDWYDYSFTSFVIETGGLCVGLYILFYAAHSLFPMQALVDGFLMSSVYHIQPNETMSVSKLKPLLAA